MTLGLRKMSLFYANRRFIDKALINQQLWQLLSTMDI